MKCCKCSKQASVTLVNLSTGATGDFCEPHARPKRAKNWKNIKGTDRNFGLVVATRQV